MPVGIEDARVVIGIDTILRNLDKTLRGIDETRTKLENLSKIKAPTFTSSAATTIKNTADAAALAAVRAQELANRQERASQAAERLAQSSLRLEQAQRRQAQASERSAAASTKQADSHIKDFQNAQKAAQKAAQEVARINEQTRRQAEQQSRIQEQAAKAIARVQTQEAQRGADAFATSLGQASAAQEQARQGTERFTNGLRNLSSGLITVGATLSAVLTAPLVALGVAGTRAAVQLDSIKRGLRAVAGSAAEADAQLARLTEIAKLPGIGFQEAIQGSVRLQTVGFSAREAERALRAFSQAVALTGGGRVELERITVQLGQLAAKGKVLSQDLRPIIEAAPAVGRALREAFGTVNAEDIQKLGLTSREFLDKLISQLETLPRVTGGARNSFDNFTDAAFRASAAIGDAILPFLTKVISVAEPAIIGLANAFKSLPTPLQTLLVIQGALLASAGPLLLTAGLLTRTIADLTPLIIALDAKALTPLILKVRAAGGAFLFLRAAATGAAGALALVSVWGAIAIAAGALAFVIYNLVTAEKQFATVTEDQVKASQDRLNALKEEVRFLKDLEGEVTRTVEQQQKLAEIYNALDIQARSRVKALGDESTEVTRLIAELEKLAKVEAERLKLQGATIAAKFANDLKKLTEQQKERLEVEEQILQIEKNRAARRDTGDQGFPVGEQEVLDGLIERHGQLNTKISEQEDVVKAGANALTVYEKVSGRSSKSTFELAKSLGQLEGDVKTATEGVEKFKDEQKAAVEVIEATNDALKEQAAAFSSLSAKADEAQKARRAIIQGAVDFLRENTNSAKDAIRGLENLRKLTPDLDKALLDEKKAKEIEKRINDILFPSTSGGDQIKRSLEQLKDAKLDSQEATEEKLTSSQRIANDERLRDNENNFKLELLAYREYLNRRVVLTNANIQLEINAQKRLLDRTTKERDDFLKKLSGKLPRAEKVEIETEVEKANIKIADTESTINRLLGEQRENRISIAQALKEQAKEETSELGKLQIEYAELTGRIQDALNAATDEQFVETLQRLGKEQDDLRKRLELSRQLKDADAVKDEEAAVRRKQAIIDTIEGIRDQEDALNALRVTQDFVNRAEEKHRGLEEDIAFQVDFRGLKEDEALRKRLAGEDQLKQRLLVSRDIVQDTVNTLLARGVQPPQALVEFIEGINRAVQGLGELSFSEKFNIAERKFSDLNDERIRKIQDVEIAVRRRTLAEVEGLIAVRRINGEYVADLERQAEVLRVIAESSGNRELIRQAERASQVAREAAEQTGSIGQQIQAAGKDAFRSGLSEFFSDILNRTRSAKEAALDLLDSIVRKVNDVIAENLSQELFESIFGGPDSKGILDKVRSLFGAGKGEAPANVGAVAGQTVESAALATASTAAAAQLTTGATVAGTTLGTSAATAAASLAGAAAALTTGIAAASTTLSTTIIAAGASFAAAVATAAAAFAAAVGASSATSSLGSLASAGAASGGLIPLRVSAGEGYIPPSDVRTMGVNFWNNLNERRLSLQRVASMIRGQGTPTSDSIPASAPSGSYILRADAMRHYSGVFLDRLTRRRRHMAAGGLVSNMQEDGFRSSRRLDLKQTIVDARSRLADELISSEGRQMLVDAITSERTEIRRRLNID